MPVFRPNLIAADPAFPLESGSSSARSQPLFIFGCPRSGTTFLGELLNHHSKVLITNELRMMSFYSDMLSAAVRARHQIHNQDLRESFIKHMRAQVRPTVESYYQQLARISHRNIEVWGDKTPGYADPELSPNCLELICETFSEAKFIHIRRHPLEVIRSLVGKRWMGVDAAIDIWVRITRRGRELGQSLPSSQYLEITHEDLIDHGERITSQVLSFIGLEEEASLTEFVKSQVSERTPYSDPIALPGTEAAFALSNQQVARIHELMGSDLDCVEQILETYAARKQTAAETAPVTVVQGSLETIPSESLLGELEVRATSIGLTINDSPAGNGARVHAGDRVALTIRAAALRPFDAIVLGLTAYDAQDRVVMGGNNADSGLKAFPLPAGLSTLALVVNWPDLGNGAYRLTIGIGEGTDGEHNLVQCWADKILTVVQETPPRNATEVVKCVVLDARRVQPGN